MGDRTMHDSEGRVGCELVGPRARAVWGCVSTACRDNDKKHPMRAQHRREGISEVETLGYYNGGVFSGAVYRGWVLGSTTFWI